MYSSYTSTLYSGNFVQLAPVHSIQFNEKKSLYFQGIYFHFYLIVFCVCHLNANIFEVKTIFHAFLYLKHAENCS